MIDQIVYVEQDKKVSISPRFLIPNESDPLFRGNGQTVFLAQGYNTVSSYGRDTVDGATYEFSERLYKRDIETSDKAWREVSENFLEGSAAIYEDYLRKYFNNPNLELVHIITGINPASGFPYQVYGFFENKKE